MRILRPTVAALAGVLLSLLLVPSGAAAQDPLASIRTSSASVTYGPYVRLEFGGAFLALDESHWLPPGASDPKISFDPNGSDVAFGAVALGHDWQNGFRAELAVYGGGTSEVTAPCGSTSDGSPCSGHADITAASVSTTGIMANLFFAPLEARGSHSKFQPFVVAGVGVARNEVGDWTRSNPNSHRPERSFEGDAGVDLAWSVGAGFSYQVTRPGRWPILLELAWRYYDFGTASGSAVPLQGSGMEQPRAPFSFSRADHVISVGVRIPLQRY